MSVFGGLRMLRVAAGRTAIVMLAVCLMPLSLAGQCQPTVDGKKSNAGAESSSATPQFYDEPQFTVAGVTDTTNLGGHGSDTMVRTKESLAKETVSLGASDSVSSSGVSQVPSSAELREIDLGLTSANTEQLKEWRGKIQALLARPSLAPRDSAALHHRLGAVEEKLRNPLAAVREYQRAAEIDPTEPYFFDWGTELLSHRAAEPATQVFARGNRLFPQSVRMLIGLGVSWHARGQVERALGCLCQAADVEPYNPNPYMFLWKVQRSEMVVSKDVLDRLGRFARLRPDDALANYYVAAALQKQGKNTTATDAAVRVEALLKKAVRLDPKLGAAHLELGTYYAGRSDLSRAIKSYLKAIETNPQLEEAHYRLAQAYRRTGEKAKAQRELEIYQQLSKKSAETFERERREIQQFVVSLRDGKPAPERP